MDSLDHHFSLDDNNFITYCRVTFIKDLTIDELSYKNMKIWSGHSYTHSNHIPDFSDFIPLPTENLTLDDLHRLEGKYIFLEYDGGMMFNYPECSAVTCMRVMKHNEIGQFYYDHDIRNEGIVVIPHREESIYTLSMINYKVLVGKNNLMSPDGELITVKKLKELDNGRKNDKINDFVWKIWVPKSYLNVTK